MAGGASNVLAHTSRAPDSVTVKRVLLNCDFRCRDEGFLGHAIERIANHVGPDKKRKGVKWARDWWKRNVDQQPGACVLFVNRALTLMAIVGRTYDMQSQLMISFYSQARFPRRVDLGALKTAFHEGWGIDVDISQTVEQKFLRAKKDSNFLEGDMFCQL
jgi:hypothetical protein